MSYITLSSFSGHYFTSDIPDIREAVSSSAVKAEVTLTNLNTGDVYFKETLWPVSGFVTLTDIGRLLEPFARASLVIPLQVAVRQLSSSDSTVKTGTSSATILFSLCDVGMTASEFYGSRFLTILDGPKVTAQGRLEYLHYYGSDAASCVAVYSDGTTATFTPQAIAGNGSYTTIDVSPSNFVRSGKTLVCYSVTAGLRSQQFQMDLRNPDCAPILIFDNSFGVQELLYCTGTHRVEPTYERKQARIGKNLRNYSIRETRTFHADTGILNTAMAQWVDELFRSQEVYVVNIVGGYPDIGKEVVITDSKSEITNDDDYLPSHTFSYQYAQRIHNVIQTTRAGRIFDNTFDATFN
ncbi:MAG: hypothetical protein II886_13145 [Prevotella sp.]|nr:hypothetical protein [Prevotella sp.]